jgi:N-acetylglutamate synthase-like GNAT family acetyltransferase
MLDDPPVEFRHGDYVVHTDRARLDLDAAIALLGTAPWGAAVTRPVLEHAVANSLAFALTDDAGTRLLGFARAVTDLATYAYLTDVVVAPELRGRGLGAWLLDCILAHPQLQGLRRIALLTRDAESLYLRAGFTRGAGDLVYLERRPDPGVEAAPP